MLTITRVSKQYIDVYNRVGDVCIPCHTSGLNYNVDVVLSALMIFGGVIGAQIGVIFGSKLKAEYLRGILAILVLAVCGKIFTDLVRPHDISMFT